MACASSTLKFTLNILNVLCCIFGILELSACTFALIEFDGGEAIKIPCVLGIVLSSVLLLISVLGCCGISQESIRVTWIYATTMLLLLMCQVTVIFLQPVNFHDIAYEAINDIWKSDLESDYMMTMFQMKFECCGKYGWKDYTEAGLVIPLSCYRHNKNTTELNLFDMGCVVKLADLYSINQRIEEITDCFLVILEGVSAIIAALFALSLKNVQRRKLYH